MGENDWFVFQEIILFDFWSTLCLCIIAGIKLKLDKFHILLQIFTFFLAKFYLVICLVTKWEFTTLVCLTRTILNLFPQPDRYLLKINCTKPSIHFPHRSQPIPPVLLFTFDQNSTHTKTPMKSLVFQFKMPVTAMLIPEGNGRVDCIVQPGHWYTGHVEEKGVQDEGD